MNQLVKPVLNFTILLLALALSGIMPGCGGGSSPVPAPAPVIRVTVYPVTANADQGGTQTFTAVVTGTTNTAVTWTVEEGAAGGSISNSGLYTAPSEAGTFHVIATSQADPTQRASAVISVPNVTMSLALSSVTLGPEQLWSFATEVVVGGTVNRAVTWSVVEGAAGGMVNSSGLYTAPQGAGSYHVEAASAADPNTHGSFMVTVVSSGYFSSAPNMGTPRAEHSATLLQDGRVLVAGGTDGNSILQSAEVFDPATSTFSPVGRMATARSHHTATLLGNGLVLIAGGENPTGTSSGAELFDPATGTFTATGSMAVGRSRHTATLLADGRVLVAGGGPDNTEPTAEIYDPFRGTFSSTGNLGENRFNHSAILLSSGKVILAGGVGIGGSQDQQDLASAEIYDPSSGKFSATGTMAASREMFTLTLTADGKALAAAGGQENGACYYYGIGNCTALVPLTNADLYDPTSGVFTPTQNLLEARDTHTATLLPSGKVLIAGGLGDMAFNWGATPLAELYDPTNGASSSTGSLLVARSWHTATLLNDGRVLIAGGIDTFGNALASSETYK